MYSNLNYIRLYDVLIDEIQRNSVAPGPGISLRIRVETLGLTGGLF